MFETNIIISLIKKIDEVKDSKEDAEYINDLFTIDNMINGIIPFDKNLIEKIIYKYKEDLDHLENLEKRLRGFQITEFNSPNNSYKQWLLNIRHSLLRVIDKKETYAKYYDSRWNTVVMKNKRF